MSGKSLVAGLIGGAALIAVVQASCDVSRRADHSAHERQLAQQVSKWRAKYAEAATQARHDVDTVRVRIGLVVTLQDTVPVWQHDTVYIRQYVEATDSALHACSDLANSCKLALAHADSVQWSMQHQIDWLTRQKTPRNKPCGVAIGAGYLLAQGQPLRAGLTVGAVCRVWP